MKGLKAFDRPQIKAEKADQAKSRDTIDHGLRPVIVQCFPLQSINLNTKLPESEDGLRRGIGEAHRRYSRMINFRENWRGHFWQGRFASYPMDETYLLAAALYVEMNPVRANFVPIAASWPWSSVQAHLSGKDDGLVKVAPLLEIVGDWKLFLAGEDEERMNDFRRHERSGRPLGTEWFIERWSRPSDVHLNGRNLDRRRNGIKYGVPGIPLKIIPSTFLTEA